MAISADCASGALPADVDPDALARYVLTVAWGMAVEAQSGASRDDLIAR
jgi:hypothetical protein